MSDRSNTDIQVYIMGQAYEVPLGLTIMDAMEYAGYRFTRGAGCRSGFCGACSTVYRREGDYKLRFALACQTTVEPEMYLVQLPFTPAPRAIYDLEAIDPESNVLLQYYPEIARCVACNTCTKACPQDIAVMDYIQAALRGDIQQVAMLSFDCIQCGLCSMRCPADIKHYHMAQMARRIYARYLSPPPEHLAQRLREIEQGSFESELESLMAMNRKQLEKAYAARELE
jgi:formate hydrogenlyase subunit 6/NADH:ubiquinone oxidoreductase subunit I